MDEPRRVTGVEGRCRFGVFEFDGRTLELSRDGRRLPIRLQALKVLSLLLARPGQLTSRDDLRTALWDDATFVDFDQGLNHAIREVRAVLGDVAESPRFVQTLPRRGYRFIAPVELLAEQDPSPSTPAASQPGARRLVHAPRVNAFWGAVGVVAVVLVGIEAYLGWRSPEAAEPPTAVALTVRPFSSAGDSALGEGLANAISARLGGQQSAAIRPLPANSAAGDAHGVTHTLDGEVTMTGVMVGVTARLREASGAILWSERVQVRRDELFNLEDVIAERIVGALELRLAAAEQDRLRRRYTRDVEAYADYLRGRAALVKYTPDGTRAAIDAFERALRRDPAYALARAGLAMACADMYLRFAPPDEVDPWGQRAEAEARAALSLDADLAEAHLARAAVARKREFDWSATLSASRRALALNPNLDQARFFLAGAYYHSGYMEEARIEMEKGRRLDGTDAIEPVRIAALIALFSGNFVSARLRLEEVSRASSKPIGDTYLGLALYYTGSLERAQTVLESLTHSSSASTGSRAEAALAGVLAAQGETSAARSRIDGVLSRSYRDHHVAYSLGAAYAQLKESKAAYRWLRTAVDTGFPCLPFFERDPLLDPLRSQSAFAELLDYVRTRRHLSLSERGQ